MGVEYIIPSGQTCNQLPVLPTLPALLALPALPAPVQTDPNHSILKVEPAWSSHMPLRCSGGPVRWGASQRPTWEEYHSGAQTAFAPTMHRAGSMLTPATFDQEHRDAVQIAYGRIASMPTPSSAYGMQRRT